MNAKLSTSKPVKDNYNSHVHEKKSASTLGLFWSIVSFPFYLISIPFKWPFQLLAKGFTALLDTNAFGHWFIHDIYYVFTGKTTPSSTEKPDPSLSSIKCKRTVSWLIAAVLISSAIFSLLMYANIYFYKTFSDAFFNSTVNLSNFYQSTLQFAGLTTVLVAIRAITKLLRKYTQSLLTSHIRQQFTNNLTETDINGLTPKTKKEAAATIEEDLNVNVSHMVISMTQCLYMCFDAIFYFFFLKANAPYLIPLAIVTTIVCFTVTYFPGEKQRGYQNEDSIKRRLYQTSILEYQKNYALYKNRNGIGREADLLREYATDIRENYHIKLIWETIYSFLMRLIKYLSIPLAFVMVAPSFAAKSITFGVVMTSLRVFKDFLSSISLIVDNRKMFNKFSTGTSRCRRVNKDIRQAKDELENKRAATFRTGTGPGDELTIPCGTKIEDENGTQLEITADADITLQPGSIVSISGESGSGKSVLARVLSGELAKLKVTLPNGAEKIAHPCLEGRQFITGSIWGHDQNTRDCTAHHRTEDRELTAAEMIAYSGDDWETTFKLEEIESFTEEYAYSGDFEDGFSTIPDYSVPYSTLSGGQKDCIGILNILYKMHQFKHDTDRFPYKLLIVDEIDQGLGTAQHQNHSPSQSEKLNKKILTDIKNALMALGPSETEATAQAEKTYRDVLDQSEKNSQSKKAISALFKKFYDFKNCTLIYISHKNKDMFSQNTGSQDAKHIPVTSLSLVNCSSLEASEPQAMAMTVSTIHQHQPCHYLLNS